MSAVQTAFVVVITTQGDVLVLTDTDTTSEILGDGVEVLQQASTATISAACRTVYENHEREALVEALAARLVPPAAATPAERISKRLAENKE